jgi:hypothetical protein
MQFSGLARPILLTYKENVCTVRSERIHGGLSIQKNIDPNLSEFSSVYMYVCLIKKYFSKDTPF